MRIKEQGGKVGAQCYTIEHKSHKQKGSAHMRVLYHESPGSPPYSGFLSALRRPVGGV